MKDFKKRLVHLHHCRGVGWNQIYTILKKDPQLKYLYQMKQIDFTSSQTSSKNTLTDLYSQNIMNNILQYERLDIKTTTIFDPDYPPILRETYKPPWVIYSRGNFNMLHRERLLAVVGSRLATNYGKNAIELLFPSLIRQKYVIVSGLAIGVDAYAHATTIKLKGETIGVIAGGFNHLYPKENIPLAQEMMKNHLVISEYPPNTRPEKWHFPMRNRIIAGISHGTLVVEAKKSSGSLITANYAVQEGRDVFSIPGPISSPFSIGTNELIQQGAKLVQTSQDIIEELSYPEKR
ncbi:DNA-processing protein DprA [Niallia sp. Krafla_26]|uniref:DNA-processing protein DprA n=1 Tax=Niallia sp. Krafla_26 TaxID=3064703 RepID=UPI003D175DF4